MVNLTVALPGNVLEPKCTSNSSEQAGVNCCCIKRANTQIVSLLWTCSSKLTVKFFTEKLKLLPLHGKGTYTAVTEVCWKSVPPWHHGSNINPISEAAHGSVYPWKPVSWLEPKQSLVAVSELKALGLLFVGFGGWWWWWFFVISCNMNMKLYFQ